ncbi:hypothetical protein NDU88_002789 [Pleurodeles waltl]|uniref:Uncharacterized protein n=1 Tax=Pleurodeles waltl TaxID=8319 RepID=A0AAV7Q9V7_PLEWA|nr:hypothetical protein NDU88_002789 [Pleurodeles waltl]
MAVKIAGRGETKHEDIAKGGDPERCLESKDSQDLEQNADRPRSRGSGGAAVPDNTTQEKGHGYRPHRILIQSKSFATLPGA